MKDVIQAKTAIFNFDIFSEVFQHQRGGMVCKDNSECWRIRDVASSKMLTFTVN